MITNLSLRDEHLIKDYYTSLFIKLTNLNPFITITIIKYDNKMYISHNTHTRHSEINCWNKINKRKRKNSDIYVSEIRCRVIEDKFEYSFSQPCLHCTKTFKHLAKYMSKHYNSNIKFRWSINGNNIAMTPYIDINDITNSTLSSYWAVKYNKF